MRIARYGFRSLPLVFGGLLAACSGGDGQADGDGSSVETVGSTDETGTESPNGDVGVGCEHGEVTAGATVVTTHGPIVGREIGDGFEFLGVPFAAPPSGELRWRAPVAPECWIESMQALEFAPACPQLEDEGGAVVGDEDCLYVNVWTPQTGPGDRPVMVFIHGGGNAIGATSEPHAHGARLATKEDVVIVTIAYRLGALGWLTDPVLAEEDAEGLAGNYGLRDQIFALEWVRDNIAEFGGDPMQVTVFGESAGAVNTCTLLGAPAAAGLFDAAIVQSGGCRQPDYDTAREDVSAPFVENAGCAGDGDVLACLRAIPVADVVTTDPDGFPDVAGFGRGWGPHVDGLLLPKSTLEAMELGEDNAVPLFVGANRDETANSVSGVTLASWQTFVDTTFGVLAPTVHELYPAEDDDSAHQAYVDLTTDLKFVCGARKTAKAAVAVDDAPVFRYHFEYDEYTTPADVTPYAFHGLELPYLFNTVDSIEIGNFEYEPNAQDEAMTEVMRVAWARFARTHDPGPSGSWPLYDAVTDPHVSLDLPVTTSAGVRTEQCDQWEAWGL